jgi:hypothetical protein
MARGIAGLRAIDITRRGIGDDEVEFCRIVRFDDWAAVRAFAGADHDAAVLPPAALRLLRSCGAESRHYEFLARHEHTDG